MWTIIDNIKKNASYFNFEMFAKPVELPSSVEKLSKLHSRFPEAINLFIFIYLIFRYRFSRRSCFAGGRVHIDTELSLNYKRESTWSRHISFTFAHLFSFASLTNLIAISLERLHATFCPFRHRFVRKWAHRAIIIVIWLITIV